MNITVKPYILDSNFISGLQETIKIIDRINKCKDDTITLTFNEKSFVTPLFILPLLVYKRTIKKDILFQNESTYIDTIQFIEEGLKSDLMEVEDFISHIKKYSYKTFIPIISFTTNQEGSRKRSAVLSAVSDLLRNQLQLSTNVLTGIKYLIEENIDNIIEHSESDYGYIFCQYYPNKGYLDICIADNGITLLGSYKKINEKNIVDHLSAMQAANSGISTKNLPDAENRGYGIKTSRAMLIGGLSGNYLMLSGNALYLKTPAFEDYINLPAQITLQGTVVAMRIPYQNNKFNYIEWVE